MDCNRINRIALHIFFAHIVNYNLKFLVQGLQNQHLYNNNMLLIFEESYFYHQIIITTSYLSDKICVALKANLTDV